MGNDRHLTYECPTEPPEIVRNCKSDDEAILSRIINCIDRKISLSMKHYETVKDV